MRMAGLRLHLTVLAVCLLTVGGMSGKVTNPSKVPKKAILLSQISSLTLRNGKSTSSRRVAAVPQLQCVGPREVCDLYHVDVMRCVNEGADYDAENIQWSCKASLPEEFKLGSTDVLCEGYESSDDPYVLKGSCGVEYRLLLTDKGEQRYGMISEEEDSSAGNSTVAKLAFFALFLGVLFVILKGIWSQWQAHPPRRRGRRGGGGGGGANDDDNDLPPPYDDPPPYFDSPRKPSTRNHSTASASQSRASSSRSAPRRTQEQNWRPGFWTGTLAGAAAGYVAGNRGQTRTESQRTAVNQARPETQQRPGGWFSNFAAPQQRQAGGTQFSSSASTSSPSYSGTRHDSTGFGETRRR